MKTKYGVAILVVILVIAGGIWAFNASSGPGPYDSLAKCLGEKGAKFYGAFWCPHCKEQKELFGSSAKYLPYIECSTPDGKGQTDVCKQANIQSYPTWEFADGSRTSGVVALVSLAQKTSCPLPDVAG